MAAEVGHFLRRKQCGAVGWAALKLDMAKAYDRVEWPFLNCMLLRLGFPARWISLIMLCVTTVRYNILINGEVAGSITPSRGIRQGDPLSPYLFIICAEGLSFLLREAEKNSLIHGIRVARGAPAISHLLFADDSLLFLKATTTEAEAVINVLNTYGKASGQQVNYHKSSLSFSRNTGSYQREEIGNMLGVVETADFGKYLGLPSFLGRNRSAVFSFIEHKLVHRIGS